MARTRALIRSLAEGRREIERLEAELRRRTVEDLVDLEVAIGVRTEQERSQEFLQMADPKRWPSGALEDFRRVLLVVSTRINQASGKVPEQNHPNVGYIQ